MIIGICGFKGAGKGEVAKVFEKHGFTRLSFASPLKDIVSTSFNLDRNLLEGNTEESRQWRDKPCSEWQHLAGQGIFQNDKVITPRIILQRMGTDLYRNHITQSFWLDLMLNKVRKLEEEAEFIDMEFKGVVIDDARFVNELDICDFTIRVERFNYSGEEILNMHISETDHLTFFVDKTIQNKSTLSDLEEQVVDFIHYIQK